MTKTPFAKRMRALLSEHPTPSALREEVRTTIHTAELIKARVHYYLSDAREMPGNPHNNLARPFND